MSGIDISRPLSGNLGAGGTFLVDLEASINEKLAKSNCPDEVRSVVALKIKKISELLIQLYNINTLNLPNEEKRQKVQELLGGTEIKDFLQSLATEISEIKGLLLEVAKRCGKEVSDEAMKVLESLETFIRDNQLLNREERTKLQEEENILKKETLGRGKDGKESVLAEGENQKMVESTSNKALARVEHFGFFEILKRIRKEGKDDPSKRMSIFSAIRAAFIEASLNKEVESEYYLEEHLDEAYERQCEIADKIKKCDEDYKKLGEQQKAVRKDIVKAAKDAMAKARSAYDQAIKSLLPHEINPEVIKSVLSNIASFSGNGELVALVNGLEVDRSSKDKGQDR